MDNPARPHTQWSRRMDGSIVFAVAETAGCLSGWHTDISAWHTTPLLPFLAVLNLLGNMAAAIVFTSFLKPLPLAASGCGAHLQLDISGEPSPLPGTLENHLLRIAQESVANAARHADANSIT